eukprot:291396_1
MTFRHWCQMWTSSLLQAKLRLEELRQLYSIYDYGCIGQVSAAEMVEMMENVGLPLTLDQTKKIFEDQPITEREFLHTVGEENLNLSRNKKAKTEFTKLAKDDYYRFDPDRAWEVLSKLGASKKDLEFVFDEFDFNSDGDLDAYELMIAMSTQSQ